MHYTSPRRGVGEPGRDIAGRRPQIGVPTGSTGDGDIPLTTPAADVYQATAAVTIPAQPPAWVIHALPPCASRKKPIASRISVISSVRNTRNVAAFTRMLQSSMYVLKIAKATRNHASELSRFGPATAFSNVFDTDASTTKMPSDIQKPPYVENAVAPNTLRLRNSHIPASSWQRPP